MTRTWIIVIALASLVACGKKDTAPASGSAATAVTGSAAPASDPRARCTRLVDKAMQWGASEKESTREQKIELCVGEPPPTSFLDCVDKATTKEAFEACE